MGSIRTIENIAKLVKTSVTTLSLPASRINIGSFQYNTAALTLNTAVTGVGGVDVAVAANSVYYTYAVVSSNVVYLIASLSSSLPSGFTQARKVGAFTTGTTSQILEAFYYGQVLTPGEWVTFAPIWSDAAGITFTTYIARYRRNVNSMDINFKAAYLSGTGTGSGLALRVPNNLTSYIPSVVGNWRLIGSGSFYNGTTAYPAYLGVYPETSPDLSPIYLSGSGNEAQVTGGAFDQVNSTLQFYTTVPIAEWAGSGTQFVW